MGRVFYLVVILIGISFYGSAQKAVKDSLLDKNLYKKNISIYKSILKNGPNKDISLKLAEALRHIGAYEQSATEYSKIMDNPGQNPIYYKNYSEVLAKIGRKEESERWRLRYKEYEKRADKLSDAHVDIDTSAYFINRIPFNSLETDFGPIFYKNGLLYVSAYSQESKNTVHQVTGESFYEFYYAERTSSGHFKSPVQVFKGINTTIYEGPVTFNKDFNKIFLIKSNIVQLHSKSKDKSIKLQLVTGNVVEDEITDITPFEYNDGIHSFSNPTLSHDGNELYFATNMDTLHGSIDLYVSRWMDGKWSKPENLGPTVNSKEDEMYPFITQTGKLYFSSQRSDSYGGLDIYMTEKKNGVWTSPVHLPPPINGIFDDFSFISDEEKKEDFFASNRAGSLGSDDIFSCTKAYDTEDEHAKYRHRTVTLVNKDNFILQNGNKIKGMLKPNGDNIDFDKVVVQLLDKNKKVVRRCYVAKDGYFSFSNLAPDDYLIVYENQKVNATPQIFIAHKNPEFVDTEDLQKYKIGYLTKDSLKGEHINFVMGKLMSVYSNTTKEESVSLILANDSGKIIKRVEVGQNGYFVFRNLPPDNYYIITEDNNPHYQSHIYYRNADNANSLLKDAWTSFRYRQLKSDSLQTTNIIIHGRIKDNYSGESTILLLDSNDKVVRRTVSNKDGYFVFRELGREDLRMFVLNDNPHVHYEYSAVYQGEDTLYHLSKSSILKKLHSDEEALKDRVAINGRLTTEGTTLPDKLVLLVDKENHVVRQTHSNEDGFFSFRKLKPDDFYMVVGESEKKYTLERYIGLDDTTLAIRESDFQKFEKRKDSFFAVQGNAFNKITHSPLENKMMLLIDTNGKVIRQTVVSKNGKFTFTNLQPDNYLVVFEQYDPEQAAEIKLIQDAATKLVQNENGKSVTYSLPIVKEENKSIVFFELRSDKVEKKYRAEIKKIVTLIEKHGIKKIEVSGYADMSGHSEYNLKLSEKRAKNCIAILREFIKDTPIEIEEKPEGATSQFINTYGTYIPALNRRVEIVLAD